MKKIKNEIIDKRKYFFKTSKAYLPVKRGSILAYSLIVLAIMIGITAAISMATVMQKKGASSTNDSVQAYQIADSVFQFAMREINRAVDPETDTIKVAFDDCEDKKVTKIDEMDVPDGTYELSFYNEQGVLLECSSPIGSMSSIKSLGIYRDAARAIQVKVKSSD